MSELINEPPNGTEFKKWLKVYLGKSYKEADKDSLLRFVDGSDFYISKT